VASPATPILQKPEVRSLLKKPVVPEQTSLLRTSLLRPDVGAAAKGSMVKLTPDLPSSITLSPAVSKLEPVQSLFKKSSLAVEMPTKPDPKAIEEVNNSWAQSLLSKSKRQKTSSSSFADSVLAVTPASPPVAVTAALTKSVTLQRVVPASAVTPGKPTTKLPTASIVAVNGSKASGHLPPPPPLRLASQLSVIQPVVSDDADYDDIAEDSDDDGPSLFEPQVILNTSSQVSIS
jgi:hypothetical protein